MHKSIPIQPLLEHKLPLSPGQPPQSAVYHRTAKNNSNSIHIEAPHEQYFRKISKILPDWLRK